MLNVLFSLFYYEKVYINIQIISFNTQIFKMFYHKWCMWFTGIKKHNYYWPKQLPFWVRTGAPECLVPAIVKGAASVDIFTKLLNKICKTKTRHTFDSGRTKDVASL